MHQILAYQFAAQLGKAWRSCWWFSEFTTLFSAGDFQDLLLGEGPNCTKCD